MSTFFMPGLKEQSQTALVCGLFPPSYLLRFSIVCHRLARWTLAFPVFPLPRFISSAYCNGNSISIQKIWIFGSTEFQEPIYWLPDGSLFGTSVTFWKMAIFSFIYIINVYTHIWQWWTAPMISTYVILRVLHKCVYIERSLIHVDAIM